MSKKKNQKYVKLLQVILAVAAVYVILKYFLSLILPFAIAYVLCRLCYPAAEKLSQKTKIPLGITSGLVIMAAAVLRPNTASGKKFGGDRPKVSPALPFSV